MRRPLAQSVTRILCGLMICAATPAMLPAQSAPLTQAPTNPPAQDIQISSVALSQAPTDPNANDSTSDNPVTLFPHQDTTRWWISGQANIVLQWHPTFQAQYTGQNSLSRHAQSATTHILTLFTGYELTDTTEVFADLEYSTGGGVGGAFGLAGYTNLDSVRTVQGIPLSTMPYLARLMLRQIIPLTHESVKADRDAFHLSTSLPARRIEFRVGKFDIEDFLDLNAWGSDSHFQFLNWTIAANGSYDYAANTRGYTDGAIVEYDDHWFVARFAETLEPKVANGINLDANIARARSANLELEADGNLIAHRRGAVRLLSYLNTANMGNYQQAVAEFVAGQTTTPNIIATRRQGRHKYGFGMNFEQEISAQIGVFGRLGWSDGRNESFAYTEVDRTLELGAFAKGEWWHRRNDRAGVGFVANGIVAAHQKYLALGGLGFLLGDGALTYGPEKIVEGFYTVHLWRGFFASGDLQHINNPGYNQARGPVTVGTLRFHTEF